MALSAVRRLAWRWLAWWTERTTALPARVGAWMAAAAVRWPSPLDQRRRQRSAVAMTPLAAADGPGLSPLRAAMVASDGPDLARVWAVALFGCWVSAGCEAVLGGRGVVSCGGESAGRCRCCSTATRLVAAHPRSDALDAHRNPCSGTPFVAQGHKGLNSWLVSGPSDWQRLTHSRNLRSGRIGLVVGVSAPCAGYGCDPVRLIARRSQVSGVLNVGSTFCSVRLHLPPSACHSRVR